MEFNNIISKETVSAFCEGARELQPFIHFYLPHLYDVLTFLDTEISWEGFYGSFNLVPYLFLVLVSC